jgi:hypothetical protein
MHMDYVVISTGGAAVVERTTPLAQAGEAIDLVAACAESETHRVLLDTPVLPDAFFELQTRFAGEFLQKLQNYQLRTAVVISPQRSYSERFEEYLREARRGRFARIFTSRAEALDWLAAA